MATLTINGQRVKVADSFLSLPPEQQNATVEEIAQSLGHAAPQQPGRSFADRFAGVQSSTNIERAAPTSPNFMDAALSTIQGATGAVPFLNQASDALVAGGQTVGDMFTGQPANFGAHYNQIQRQRENVANKAPIANILGAVGGTAAGAGALGAGGAMVPAFSKGGAVVLKEAPSIAQEALGLSGSFGKQLVNSIASNAGYEGLQGLAHGHKGEQLLADLGIGGGTGALGSLIGQGVSAVGDSLAKRATAAAQRRAIDAAPAATTSRELKSAGSQLFESAFNGNPPAVSDNAMMRLVGDIQNGVAKIRPNAANDPQAVGLLQHVMELADAANTPGTVVDLKDLHLARQLAQKVAQSPNGRDSAVGSIVIDKLDNFINSLGPSDILGGADPSSAANAMYDGIRTWRQASKLSAIEDTVAKAETYKSGRENGLKLAFLGLMKSPDFKRFSPVEQSAIREIAKGTTTQNIAELFGKLGLSLGGSSAHNIVGAGIGTSALTGVLSPFMGMAALPAAGALTTAAGFAGRKVAQESANKSIARALKAFSTSNIPQVAERQNLLAPANVPLQILIRGSGAGMATSPR